jgi:hypothetical protein
MPSESVSGTTDNIANLDQLVKWAAKDPPLAEEKRALAVVNGWSIEASTRLDRLNKWIIVGITAANATGLSVALGMIRGDMNANSPLLLSSVLFAAGLTVALINPLLDLGKVWQAHRTFNAAYLKLMNRQPGEQALNVFDALLRPIEGTLAPWYDRARFMVTATSILFFVGGLWWPIVSVVKRLLQS